MPIAAYYHGHGTEVMASMRKRYGARAKAVFYATANKRKQKPGLSNMVADHLRTGRLTKGRH